MNTIKLNGVTVDVEEARKAVAEFDAQKDKLIGGLTIEQWQRVIDGKFYCEFGEGGKWYDWISLLTSVDVLSDFPFKTTFFSYNMCRPAQKYGIRVPVFNGRRPDWLKDDDLIIMAIWANGNITVGSDCAAKDFCFEDLCFEECTEIIAMPAGGKIE